MILSPLTQQLFQLNFCFLWSRVLNRSVPGLGAGGEAAALAFPAARLLRRGRGPHLKSPLMGAQRYLVSGKQILVLSTQSPAPPPSKVESELVHRGQASASPAEILASGLHPWGSDSVGRCRGLGGEGGVHLGFRRFPGGAVHLVRTPPVE